MGIDWWIEKLTREHKRSKRVKILDSGILKLNRKMNRYPEPELMLLDEMLNISARSKMKIASPLSVCFSDEFFSYGDVVSEEYYIDIKTLIKGIEYIMNLPKACQAGFKNMKVVDGKCNSFEEFLGLFDGILTAIDRKYNQGKYYVIVYG